MSVFLDNSISASISSYLEMCKKIGADVDFVERMAIALISKYKGRSIDSVDEDVIFLMENRWYDSLSMEPEWSIYEGDYYLSELWACWVVYSKKTIASIGKTVPLLAGSIVDDLGSIDAVFDLGCGIGYTTAALVDIFPDAEIFGTNLEGTLQRQIAEKMGKRFGFSVVSDVHALDFNSRCLIVASEYFEHFQKPVEHLKEVLKIRPIALVIANAFGQRALGHFDCYKFKSGGFGMLKSVIGNKASRLFNAELRRAGYEKQSTGLWNDRPSYWRLSDGLG